MTFIVKSHEGKIALFPLHRKLKNFEIEHHRNCPIELNRTRAFRALYEVQAIYLPLVCIDGDIQSISLQKILLAFHCIITNQNRNLTVKLTRYSIKLLTVPGPQHIEIWTR